MSNMENNKEVKEDKKISEKEETTVQSAPVEKELEYETVYADKEEKKNLILTYLFSIFLYLLLAVVVYLLITTAIAKKENNTKKLSPENNPTESIEVKSQVEEETPITEDKPIESEENIEDNTISEGKTESSATEYMGDSSSDTVDTNNINNSLLEGIMQLQ